MSERDIEFITLERDRPFMFCLAGGVKASQKNIAKAKTMARELKRAKP